MKTKNRHLKRYLQSEEALPFTDEIDERLTHLLGIADALKTGYPHNELFAAVWLITLHKRF